MKDSKDNTQLRLLVVISCIAVSIIMTFCIVRLIRNRIKVVDEGIDPPGTVNVFVCGVSANDDSYLISLTKKVETFLSSIGLSTSKEYRECFSLDLSGKFSDRNCFWHEGRLYCILVLPPANGKPLYSLNKISLSELVSLGLSEEDAQRVLYYRAENEFTNKKDLLTHSLLTEEEYALICNNVYALPPFADVRLNLE